ncbi:MAG: GFA family protein [Rhodanobacteraceae bacterium]|nr:GFA family protein [Rhodanobacteraceae bacterium]
MELNQGSCLCGSVQFEVRGPFEHFFLCHCTYCRKDSGSAHAANLFSCEAALHWKIGRELVATFQLPNTRHVKSFCTICGSALPHVAGSAVVVPAGCLDSTPAIAPQAHLFVDSRAAWDRELEWIPAFSTVPSA